MTIRRRAYHLAVRLRRLALRILRDGGPALAAVVADRAQKALAAAGHPVWVTVRAMWVHLTTLRRWGMVARVWLPLAHRGGVDMVAGWEAVVR